MMYEEKNNDSEFKGIKGSPPKKKTHSLGLSKAFLGTNDPALPDSPDRSDLAGDASGWGGIKLSVRGLPFR